MAWTPSHMECQRREGRGGFFLCATCLEKEFRRVELKSIPYDNVTVQPMHGPPGLSFFNQYRYKNRKNT